MLKESGDPTEMEAQVSVPWSVNLKKKPGGGKSEESTDFFQVGVQSFSGIFCVFFLRNDSKEKNSDEQDPFFFFWGGGWGDIFFSPPKV